MTQLLSVSGTRLDCDICGEHVFAPYAGVEALRAVAHYAVRDGLDVCPTCRPQLEELKHEFPNLVRLRPSSP
jgi:hypothetical protein